MRREQAAALHDLFAVAVEMGQPVEAERLAEIALQVFGRRNRRVHVLAHDVAYFWMEQGYYARALSIFQAVLPVTEKPIERLFVLADLARAAGGCSDIDLAEEASDEVRRLAAQPELEHGAARALIEIARAYVSLGDRKKAEVTARQAIRCATKFRESKVRFAAEALLDALMYSAGGQAPAESPAPIAVDGASDPITGDRLAADFIKTLESIAGEPRV
jgi:tetratricopeptide (TPR) repeat protein